MDTTRRTMLTSAVACAILALPLGAQAALTADEQLFLAQATAQHRRGREVALKAIAAGVGPDQHIGTQLYSRDHPEDMPRMFFEDPHRSGGQIIVSALGIEHGESRARLV